MAQLLSDQDVFGAPAQPRLLSDDEVFSQPQQPNSNPVSQPPGGTPDGATNPASVLDNQQSSLDYLRAFARGEPNTTYGNMLPLSHNEKTDKTSFDISAPFRGAAGTLADWFDPEMTASTSRTEQGGQGPSFADLAGLAGVSPAMKVGIPKAEGTLTNIATDPTVAGGLKEAAQGELPKVSSAPSLTKSQLKARDIISQALETEGINPEDIAQKLEQAKETGLPLTALDVATQNVGGVQTQGRNLLGLADAAANMPGEGATMAGDVAARGYTAKQRIGSAFDKFISSGKPYDVTDDALQRMSTEAGPAYEKAFSAAPVTSQRVEQFLKDPDIQAGIGRGIHIQRLEALAEGRPFDPNDYQVVGFSESEVAKTPYGYPAAPTPAPIPIIHGTPNMRLLDAGKQGLDAMIGDETNDLTGRMTQMGRALTKLKQSYVGELDNLNPDYAAARNAYGSQASRLQALKDGMNFMQMQPEEIKRYMADPNNTLADQMAFSVGVRQKLQDSMSQVGDNANAVTRLWKDSIRDRLEPMFGDKDAFAQFSDLMNHEQNMARINGVLTRGSQTMPRQQYAQAITQSPSRAGKLLGMVTNPKGAAVDAGLGFLDSQLQKSAAGITNDTAAEIMRHLTTNDPNVWYDFGKYSRATGGRVGYAKGGRIGNYSHKTWAKLVREHGKEAGVKMGHIHDPQKREKLLNYAAGGTVYKARPSPPQTDDETGNDNGRWDKQTDAHQEQVLKQGSKSGEVFVNDLSVNNSEKLSAGGKVNTSPTEAQKAVGNYKKDHIKIYGLDVTIENPKGSMRSGKEKNGKPWNVKMPAHYGYIRGTVGADKDHVDCYMGPKLGSRKVFVIDQKNAENGAFDEHKCMIGYLTKETALRDYKNAFSDGKGLRRLGKVTEMNIDDFKKWLQNGDTTKPMRKVA